MLRGKCRAEGGGGGGGGGELTQFHLRPHSVTRQPHLCVVCVPPLHTPFPSTEKHINDTAGRGGGAQGKQWNQTAEKWQTSLVIFIVFFQH